MEWILDGVPLAETMPTFRDRLFEDEVRATIAFIKTTWPAEVRHMHAKGTKQFAAQQAR